MKRSLTCVLLAVICFAATAQDNPLRISELVTVNSHSAYDTHQEPEDWLELYNPGNSSILLDGCFLAESPNAQPPFPLQAEQEIAPGGYGMVFCDPVTLQGSTGHCNLKLRSEGGWLGLFDANSNLIDSITYPALTVDQSFGRVVGSKASVWFNRPSPGAANDSVFASSNVRCQPVQFSLEPKPLKKPTELTLSAPNATQIYWARGKRDPLGGKGKLYTEPIKANGGRMVRAAAIGEGCLSGPAQSIWFPPAQAHTVPMVSIVCEPWSRFYEKGRRSLTSRKRAATLSWYTDSGELEFSTPVALKLAGGASRMLSQKSISIRLQPEFNSGDFTFPALYADKSIANTTDFVLRNFGNGYPRVFFKDVLLQQLLANNLNIDYLGYRTVVAYVNGRYWGLYNIREKKTVRYPAANHGIDPANVDMV